MAIAEGRTIPFAGPEAIDVAVLETFEYAGPEQEIVTETREFSAGLPLQRPARLRHAHASTTSRRDRCIELKSLKYYVTSYRNVGIFQEHATAQIAEDLFAAAAAAAHCHHALQHAGRVRHDLHGDACRRRALTGSVASASPASPPRLTGAARHRPPARCFGPRGSSSGRLASS